MYHAFSESKFPTWQMLTVKLYKLLYTYIIRQLVRFWWTFNLLRNISFLIWIKRKRSIYKMCGFFISSTYRLFFYFFSNLKTLETATINRTTPEILWEVRFFFLIQPAHKPGVLINLLLLQLYICKQMERIWILYTLDNKRPLSED